MLCEFFNTGLSGGMDLIVPAEEFLKAKYDEREWNALKYAVRAFALAGGSDYGIGHTDYVTIRGWLRASREYEVVFVLKDDPGAPAPDCPKCCDAYVVTEDGPQPVIVNDETGRSMLLHRK